MKTQSLLMGLLIAANTYPALAASDKEHNHDHEMEQHGSHEHSVARLTVAVESKGMEITLDSPAANLFGFEHNASTDEQHKIVHQAEEKLEDPKELFTLAKGAECQWKKVDIDSKVIAAHKAEKHDHKHDHETHSDVVVNWNLSCEHADKLTELGVNLFDAFPRGGFDRLTVEWVTESGAGSQVLTSAGNVKFSNE